METDALVERISTEVDQIIGNRRGSQVLVPVVAFAGIAIGIAVFDSQENVVWLIALSGFGWYLAYQLFRRFNAGATRRLMPILAKMAGNWDYVADPHNVPTDTLCSQGLLPDADKTTDSHLVSGEIGALPFRYWSTHLENQGSKSTTTVFRGSVLEMPAVEGQKFALVRPAKSKFMRAITDFFSAGNERYYRLPEEINSGHQSSYAVFVARVSDGDDLRAWVVPRIAKCNRLLPSGVRIHGVFHTDKKLFLAIDGMEAPYLSSGLYSPKEQLLREVQGIVKAMAKPIDLLEVWHRPAKG